MKYQYRITQHTVSKRWRIERGEERAFTEGLGIQWESVRADCFEGYLFRWWANWIMWNLIAEDVEQETYDNGEWEKK